MNGVSIIVCCYNSSKRLPATIQYLKQQKIQDEIPWEVIIVDNASTDDTSKTAYDEWNRFADATLRVISEPKPGLSNARTSGFNAARYDFISFVDDDNWIAQNWVENVYKIMLYNPKVGACGGRSEAVFEFLPPEWYPQFFSKIAVGEQSIEEGDITDTRGWLWGAGLTVRKQAFKEVIERNIQFYLSDRNEKKLSSGGDNEICYSLRLLGWRLFYSSNLNFKHFIPSTRLSWNYFCEMSKANGYSSTILSRYNRVLKQRLPSNYLSVF